jgi:hypothetical protein
MQKTYLDTIGLDGNEAIPTVSFTAYPAKTKTKKKKKKKKGTPKHGLLQLTSAPWKTLC